MVLTNFECWAHGGSDNVTVNTAIERRGNSVDLFNPVVLQQTCNNDVDQNCGAETDVKSVSHFSSNGYYGFVACSVASPANVARPDVDNQKELVNSANSTRISFGGEDSMMDVEQEHMVYQHSVGGADGSVVNSMFSKEEPVLAQTKLWKSDECNRFCIDRRKRGFASRSGNGEMQMGASKRFRVSEEGCCIVEHDDISSFSVNHNKTLEMDQEDVISENTVRQNALLSNVCQPKDIIHANDQFTSTTSLHADGPLQTSNKSNGPSNKLIDDPLDGIAYGSPSNVKYILDTNLTNGILTLEFRSNMEYSNSSKLIQPQMNNLTHNDETDTSISNQIETTTGLNIINKSNEQLHQTKASEIKLNKKKDDLLENLFLSLHGGNHSHMLRQLSRDHISNDEI